MVFPALLALLALPGGVVCPPDGAGGVHLEGSRATPSGTAVPRAVGEALVAALSLPGAALEVVSWDPDGSCVPERAEVKQPIRGSGRVAVRLQGSGCDGWAWARVRVVAPAFVTTSAIPSGDPLKGSFECRHLEVRSGRVPVTELPAGAVAARPLAEGTVIEARHLRDDRPAPGEPVVVVVKSGVLHLEQKGRIAPCGREKVCALLPGGKKVEGRWEEGQVVVELP